MRINQFLNPVDGKVDDDLMDLYDIISSQFAQEERDIARTLLEENRADRKA
jgi:hypothetical protein